MAMPCPSSWSPTFTKNTLQALLYKTVPSAYSGGWNQQPKPTNPCSVRISVPRRQIPHLSFIYITLCKMGAASPAIKLFISSPHSSKPQRSRHRAVFLPLAPRTREEENLMGVSLALLEKEPPHECCIHTVLSFGSFIP